MSTENDLQDLEPQDQDPGTEPQTEPTSDPGLDAAPPRDDGQQPSDGEPRNRQERRRAYARAQEEAKAAKAAAEAAARENAELRRQMAEFSTRVGRLTEVQERMLPRAPDPLDAEREAAFAAVEDALAEVDPKNPKSLRRYHEAQAKLSRVEARMEFREQQQRLPPPPPPTHPVVDQFRASNPWIEEHDAEEMVAAMAKRLGKDRDMRNPQVLRSTLNEAAARVRATLGIPAQEPHAKDRFAAPTGRASGSGPAAPTDVPPFQVTHQMESLAMSMFPSEKNVETAVKKWWAAIRDMPHVKNVTDPSRGR